MSASVLPGELTGIPNPFRSGIVRDAWDPDWVDVPEIHSEASARLLQEVEQVRGGRGGCGILVYGEPGSGKTHLLNRLRRWCLQTGTVFSGIRLQCGPQTIWRHLRREFADSLLRPLPDQTSQLSRLLSERTPAQIRTLSYATKRVLDHWREGRHMHECEAWLRGEPLPPSVLDLLEIKQAESDEDLDELESTRRIQEMLALLSPGPVVLALDQIEAMQAHTGDSRGLEALGTTAAHLRDQTPHLVLVTCIQSSFMDELCARVRRADLDRMREVSLELAALTVPQAEALVKARLDAEPLLNNHPKRRASPLWPFPADAIRIFVEKDRAGSPRKLIARAKELFERLRGRQGDEESVRGQFLSTEFQRRIEQVNTAAVEAGNEFLLDGMRRIMAVAGWRETGKGGGGIDLSLEKKGRQLALVMFNKPYLTGAFHRLRKLSSSESKEQIRLMRSSSLPLPSSAKKTLELLEELKRGGARLVRVAPEAIAALEACSRLLADAAAGDLHCDGETLGREFVEQWMRAEMPPELRDLVAAVEAGESGGDPPPDALIEFIRARKVATVAEAAASLGVPEEEVRRCADQAADFVCCVGDPPQVLFERCGTGA